MTADEVEVRFTAATDQYLRDLFTADKAFNTVVKNMEKNAVAAGAAFSNIATRAEVGAQQAVTAFSRMRDASQNVNANVGNIAAQFQDIGVTAAAGMNPMLIALQQGTQLSAVLNQSLTQGVSPVKALGAAFVQILNPISLATIALVAVGAAAIQYFGTLLADGPASEEELKKQDAILREIGDKWGDLVPAVKAYIEARDRATESKETAAGFEDLIKRGWDAARQSATDAGVQFAEVLNQLNAIGADGTPEVAELQDAFRDLQQSTESGNATTAQAERLTAALAAVINQSGIPSVAGLKTSFDALAVSIANANQQQAEFLADQGKATSSNLTAKFIADQQEINSLTSDELKLRNEIGRVQAEADRGGVILTEEQALNLAEQRLAAEERRREIAKQIKEETKDGKAAAKEYDTEREAVEKLIDALAFELSTIGLTNEQKAVAVALRQAGAAATEQERLEIEGLVEATYAQTEALQRQREAYDEIKNLAGTVLKGFISDIREGKSAGEAFAGVLDNIIDKLIEIAINAALNSIFPGLGVVGGLFGGGRASGGPVSRGKTYMVGERGPELFTPSSAGSITPNHKLGGAGETRIVLDVQEGAAFSTRVREVAGPQSVAVTSSGIQTYDRALPGRSAEKDARYG